MQMETTLTIHKYNLPFSFLESRIPLINALIFSFNKYKGIIGLFKFYYLVKITKWTTWAVWFIITIDVLSFMKGNIWGIRHFLLWCRIHCLVGCICPGELGLNSFLFCCLGCRIFTLHIVFINHHLLRKTILHNFFRSTQQFKDASDN